MEVEEEEDDPRDVLRVDLVPTMEDKVGGSSSRRKGEAKCLDRPVFSTCFQLLTWQQRHLRLDQVKMIRRFLFRFKRCRFQVSQLLQRGSVA